MGELESFRGAILAALGVAACSSSSGGSAVTEVDVPPPGPGVLPVAEGKRPERAGIGYVKEPNGNVRRASPVTCDAAIDQPACRGDEGHKQCSSDADCKDGPHGKCVSGSGQIGTYCGCEYACASDDECKPDQACVCKEHTGEGHSVCAQAGCKADADCAGGQCGVSSFNNGCFTSVSLTCRSPADTCASDADCNGGRGACRASAAPGRAGAAAPTKWSCQTVSCAIGRPFVVAGASRTAGTSARDDWCDPVLTTRWSTALGELDEEGRARGARRWAAIAELEHASVASFARASLQLLALGAPPELLQATHAAAADEVRHARIAFSLARAHGALDAGPGRIDLGGALSAVDAAEVARAVAHEGCVGETLGAAEARAEVDAWSDPEIAAALASIADDEASHAVLAWRTLAWLVSTHGETAAAAAREGIEAALAELVGGGGALRAATARDVVRPCAAALLGAAVHSSGGVIASFTSAAMRSTVS